jgi:hypothetical protein
VSAYNSTHFWCHLAYNSTHLQCHYTNMSYVSMNIMNLMSVENVVSAFQFPTISHSSMMVVRTSEMVVIVEQLLVAY